MEPIDAPLAQCSDCSKEGVLGIDVKLVWCPFEYEVRDKKLLALLCDRCIESRLMET